jgi:hypothetical protein
VTAWVAARAAACGGCELRGARWHLERAVAELEEARLSWGVWADGVRKLAERRLGVSVAEGLAVLDDPGYAQALRMGGWFDDAIVAGLRALEVAGGAGEGLLPECPCLLAEQQ